MSEKKVEKGEVVFSEGDVADVAYIVISGRIELFQMNHGREVQVRVVEPGKIFGDLAVFDERALRPVTSRALEPCVLKVITPEEFKALVAQCPAGILPFLEIAFVKMKATKTKVQATADVASSRDATKLLLSPDSDVMKAQFKPLEIPVAKLPFRIGGYPAEGGEANRRDQVNLSLAVQGNPLRVSRQHCEICAESKGYMVVDLGSRFGTTINGVAIGRGRGFYNAPLKKGINQVTLGDKDGPYKLTIKCE